MTAPDGTTRDYKMYVLDKEIIADSRRGVLAPGEPFLYRDVIAVLLDIFRDEDGEEHTQLIEIANVGGYAFNPMMGR